MKTNEMQTIRPLLLAGACGALLLANSSASAAESGFYLKADAGGAWTLDTKLKEFFGPVAPDSTVSFDPGARFGLAGGYELTDWFAVELQQAWVSSGIDTVTDATRVHEATFTTVPLLANLRFQGPRSWRLSPYCGGGLGGAASILDADRLEVGGTRFHGTEATAVFAYQAFAGLSYRMTPHAAVSVEYRYVATTDPEWKADATVGTTSDHVRFGGAETHSISLAFTYRF